MKYFTLNTKSESYGNCTYFLRSEINLAEQHPVVEKWLSKNAIDRCEDQCYEYIEEVYEIPDVSDFDLVEQGRKYVRFQIC